MTSLPSLDALKSQAKSLRAELARTGNSVSHAQSLELLAKQLGYRDWNTLHAATGNRPPAPDFALGMTVQGTYLGHPVRGEIIAIRTIGEHGYHVTIELEEPVDVVKFDSFSAYRRRINGTISREGVTTAKTSDGEPHLKLKV